MAGCCFMCGPSVVRLRGSASRVYVISTLRDHCDRLHLRVLFVNNRVFSGLHNPVYDPVQRRHSVRILEIILSNCRVYSDVDMWARDPDPIRLKTSSVRLRGWLTG